MVILLAAPLGLAAVLAEEHDVSARTATQAAAENALADRNDGFNWQLPCWLSEQDHIT
jgi:hypothetical protein